MNKDEMIEDMAKTISDCSMGDCVFCNGRHKCIYYKSAESLYNAGCRKVGEDEMVIKKSEYKELKTHIEDLQTKLGAVLLCIKNTHEIDISDLLRKQEQETARRILQDMWNKRWSLTDLQFTICDMLAEYDIELNNTTYSEDKGND